MMGQPEGLVHLDLPLPHPELPDVVVAHLHHILGLDYVLASATMPGRCG